jgi:hypothetical protein
MVALPELQASGLSLALAPISSLGFIHACSLSLALGFFVSYLKFLGGESPKNSLHVKSSQNDFFVPFSIFLALCGLYSTSLA